MTDTAREAPNDPSRFYRDWEEFRFAWRVLWYFRDGWREALAGKPLDFQRLDRDDQSAVCHYELGRQWALTLGKKAGRWEMRRRPPIALRRAMYPNEDSPT